VEGGGGASSLQRWIGRNVSSERPVSKKCFMEKGGGVVNKHVLAGQEDVLGSDF